VIDVWTLGRREREKMYLSWEREDGRRNERKGERELGKHRI
jgi:hypothetical protein